MEETEESGETGRFLQVDAIVIPSSYITSGNEEPTFNSAFHEFNQDQVDECLREGRFLNLPVCYEHDEHESSRLGTVTGAYLDEKNNLCCGLEIDSTTLPGRVAEKFLHEGLKNSTSLRHDVCKLIEPESKTHILGKVLKEVSLTSEPRRAGATVKSFHYTDHSLISETNTPSGSFKDFHCRDSALVQSCASLDSAPVVSIDTASIIMSESESAPMSVDEQPAQQPVQPTQEAAPEEPQAAAPEQAAAPAQVEEEPLRKDGMPDMRFAVNKSSKTQETADNKIDEPKAAETPQPPKQPEVAHSDPLVQTLAQSVMSMSGQIGALAKSFEARESIIRQKEAEAEAEKQRVIDEQRKQELIKQAEEEQQLAGMWRTYMEPNISPEQASAVMSNFRRAGPEIWQHQVQLLESKASAAKASAQKLQSYMGSQQLQQVSAPVVTKPAPAMKQSRGHAAVHPEIKRRGLEVPMAAAPEHVAVNYTCLNDVLRANPLMGEIQRENNYCTVQVLTQNCSGYDECVELASQTTGESLLVSAHSLRMDATTAGAQLDMKVSPQSMSCDLCSISERFNREFMNAESLDRNRKVVV